MDDSVLDGTMVVTDAWQGYASLQERGFDHLPVAERDEARVAEEYMPLILLVFSNLKAWINGVHHGVDPQHLQAYCNEFTFRFNWRFYPFNSFRSLLGIAADAEASDAGPASSRTTEGSSGSCRGCCTEESGRAKVSSSGMGAGSRSTASRDGCRESEERTA